MKVLQINSVYGVGSTGKIVADIHSVLVQKGHDSFVAYGRGNVKRKEGHVKIGNRIDILYHGAITRILDRHGYGSISATRKLLYEIDAIDPDIIHLHNIHGYYLNIKILFDYLKRFKKNIVWTLHDCWGITGHCSYFDYVECAKWKTGCHHCPQKKEYPKSVFFDYSKNNYLLKKSIFTGLQNMMIVTPSVWLSNIVKKSYLKDYPVNIINNGIDLDVFRWTESDFKEKARITDKFVILGVASIWEKRKGLKTFFDIASRVSSDTVIVLVGLSKKQIMQLPANCIGITRTNSAYELTKIYSAADVFVNPTLEDNYPTVNLEAIACDVPVISYDSGGSGEMITKNTGIVVHKNDTDAMMEAILRIKNGSWQGRKKNYFMQNGYSKYDCVNEYIGLYQELYEKNKQCQK